MNRSARILRLRYAVVLGLLLTSPGVSAAIVGAATPSDLAASAVAGAVHARTERLLELIDESSVPGLVGERRWRELVNTYRPLLERSRRHREFAETANDLFRAAGISHFHYYTDEDWFYWHVLSVFGSRGPETYTDHIGLFTQRIDGRWFVRGILEGSVAAGVPIRVGDELVSVDGRPFEPIASFRGKAGQPVQLKVRRKPGLLCNFTVTPVRESLHQAVQRAIEHSIRVIDHGDHRFVYAHMWTLLGHGETFTRLLEMQDEVDGLLLDFRDGFGGRSHLALRFLFGGSPRHRTGDYASAWTKPLVILIADGTRSAKEIVVDSAKREDRALLVGTPTPGHVTSVGAVRRVASDALVMLPGQRFALEGHPTTPDVYIERDIRYSAGADPQLRLAKALLSKLAFQ